MEVNNKMLIPQYIQYFIKLYTVTSEEEVGSISEFDDWQHLARKQMIESERKNCLQKYLGC